MSKRKTEALKAVAARGGTENERQVASEKLKNAKPVETALVLHTEDKWTPGGVIVRSAHGDDTRKSYLRGAALNHFLRHVEDGDVITSRHISFSPEFGSGDFYTIINWLQQHELAVKWGSKYEIISVAKIKELWNKCCDQMKL